MFNRNINQYLKKWQNKRNRKPLVLRGARQVGKTSAVKHFALNNFNELVYINLDKNEVSEAFKSVNTMADFEKVVNIIFGKKIVSGSTLIFIDEIQNAPQLIELLRFFYEEKPDWHVVAAGSLLEAMLIKQGLSMPVGRVEYAYMYPLTFFEFLEAVQEKNLLEYLENFDFKKNILPAVHDKALKLYHDYALIGGMPEVVASFAEKSTQEELNTVYSSLLTAYKEDIYKYASMADLKYVRHVLEQTPYFAGERVTYEKFGGSVFRSREMSEAFSMLEKALIVRQIEATESRSLPLVPKSKRAKKLLFLDCGFVNFKNNIQSEYVKNDDLSDIYRGKIAEQIVGQNLLASCLHDENPLFYWAKEKPNGSAEVDFCLSHKGEIYGIEVKSGHSARLKSLFSFFDSTENSRLIRVYSGPFQKELIRIAAKEYPIISLPFYLVNRIFDVGGIKKNK